MWQALSGATYDGDVKAELADEGSPLGFDVLKRLGRGDIEAAEEQVDVRESPRPLTFLRHLSLHLS
jgi:hypothetical protein